MTSTVHPVHFEDYSGAQFERLVFAYHVRAGWRDLVWHGQSGGDQGRDISGIEEFDGRPPRITIIQCANRDTLTLAKARTDMEKAVAAGGGKPDAFKFVCRGAVSDASRTRIGKAAAALSVEHVTIWSSVEFEENLRMRAEYLLHRFVRGVEFPEAEAEIRKFVDDFPDLSDADALGLMAAVFDRPAFRTPFQQESSLPAFQQAIEDTIGALNTGVWRTREGTDIRRIPSIRVRLGHGPLLADPARQSADRTVRQSGVVRATASPDGVDTTDPAGYLLHRAGPAAGSGRCGTRWAGGRRGLALGTASGRRGVVDIGGHRRGTGRAASRRQRRPGHCRDAAERTGNGQRSRQGTHQEKPRCPADAHNPPWIRIARHGEQGHGAAAVPAAVLQQGDAMTAELRLGPLAKTAMIKLTIAIPEKLKVDLDRYAELHTTRWGEPIDAAALIPHMLEAFIARDRGFRKARLSSRRSNVVSGPAQ